MSHRDAMYQALRDLKAQAAKEQDPEELRKLIIEVNHLLDIIERQVTWLQGGNPPSSPPQ